MLLDKLGSNVENFIFVLFAISIKLPQLNQQVMIHVESNLMCLPNFGQILPQSVD